MINSIFNVIKLRKGGCSGSYTIDGVSSSGIQVAGTARRLLSTGTIILTLYGDRLCSCSEGVTGKGDIRWCIMYHSVFDTAHGVIGINQCSRF